MKREKESRRKDISSLSDCQNRIGQRVQGLHQYAAEFVLAQADNPKDARARDARYFETVVTADSTNRGKIP